MPGPRTLAFLLAVPLLGPAAAAAPPDPLTLERDNPARAGPGPHRPHGGRPRPRAPVRGRAGQRQPGRGRPGEGQGAEADRGAEGAAGRGLRAGARPRLRGERRRRHAAPLRRRRPRPGRGRPSWATMPTTSASTRMAAGWWSATATAPWRWSTPRRARRRARSRCPATRSCSGWRRAARGRSSTCRRRGRSWWWTGTPAGRWRPGSWTGGTTSRWRWTRPAGACWWSTGTRPSCWSSTPAPARWSARLPTCGDADDVFWDAKRERVYVSCGEGVVDVLRRRGDTYEELARVPTAAGRPHRAVRAGAGPALRRGAGRRRPGRRHPGAPAAAVTPADVAAPFVARAPVSTTAAASSTGVRPTIPLTAVLFPRPPQQGCGRACG